MKFLLKQFVLPRQKKTKTNEELTNSVGTLRYKIQYLVLHYSSVVSNGSFVKPC